MKKAILKGTVIIACIAGAYCLYTDQNSSVTNLAMANIEALASGESGGSFHCYGEGSIDCYGFKVEMKVNTSRMY